MMRGQYSTYRGTCLFTHHRCFGCGCIWNEPPPSDKGDRDWTTCPLCQSSQTRVIPCIRAGHACIVNRESDSD